MFKLVDVFGSLQAQVEILLLRVSADLYLDNPGTVRLLVWLNSVIMVVHIIAGVLSKTVESYFYLPLIAGFIGVYYLKAWSSGKRTDRERDLHGRTILLTVS